MRGQLRAAGHAQKIGCFGQAACGCDWATKASSLQASKAALDPTDVADMYDLSIPERLGEAFSQQWHVWPLH